MFDDFYVDIFKVIIVAFVIFFTAANVYQEKKCSESGGVYVKVSFSFYDYRCLTDVKEINP
jgi:hypothetical protein